MHLYGYENLKRDMGRIRQNPYVRIYSIGTSVLGRELYCIQMGKGPRRIFINGTHHALESITAAMLVQFIKEWSDCLQNDSSFYGYPGKQLWHRSTLFLVPMVNPDGVELVKSGKIPFQNWQSNAHGVDLNHNYNAGWAMAKEWEPSVGVYGPGPTRFGGSEPESEPETRAMTRFSREMNFHLALCYHTQGEEIYHRYLHYMPKRSEELGALFTRASGYRLSHPDGIASHGGYKDWFLKTFFQPAFTIEAGYGKNPLPLSQLSSIYAKNKQLLALAALHG